MKFIPENGNLLVETLETKTEQVRQVVEGFELPETYVSEEDQTSHVVVKLIRDDKGEDCDELLVVERHGIEIIKYGNETFTVVKKVFVVGRLEPEYDDAA